MPPIEHRTGEAGRPEATRDDRGRTPRPVSEEQLERGALVGRYVVLERIGFGGMGVVYAAYDPELDRKVAVKVLRSRALGAADSLAPDEAQARLVREAQAMARVSHPNVVAVYDVGTLGDRVFITMELIQGQTITQWLAAAPRAWQDIVSTYAAAGAGLAAAHHAGLVHRDFKPDNVLVGQAGRVFVTDFGLVRPSLLGPAATPAPPLAVAARPVSGPRRTPGRARREPPSTPGLGTPLTEAGAILGTPGYMAPEQYRAEIADARSDQFSFCVALHEALTGQRPVVPISSSAGAAREPAAPGRAQVPAWIRRVLARGLQLDPAGRYPSMDALLLALGRDPRRVRLRRLGFLGAAVVVAGVGFAVRAGVQARAERCSGAPLKLAGVWDAPVRASVERAFLGTGLPFARASFETVARQLDERAAAFSGLHREVCEATEVRREQSEVVRSLRMECLDRWASGLRSTTGLLAHADRQIVEHAVAAVSAQPALAACSDVAALRAPVPPPTEPALRAKVEAARTALADAQALADAGKVSQALALAAPLVEPARTYRYRPLEAEVLQLVGWLQERTGAADASEASLKAALTAAIAGRDDATAAAAARVLTQLEGTDRAHLPAAQQWFHLGMAHVERMGGNALLEADLHSSLASAYLAQGDHAPAAVELRRVVELREEALGRDHLLTSVARSNEGVLLYLQGDYVNAEARMRRALVDKERLLGSEHPSLALDIGKLANVLVARNEYEEALGLVERGLKLAEGNMEVRLVLSGELAQSHFGLGHYERALEEARRGVALFTAARGARHPATGNARDVVASVLLRSGRPEQALAEYQRALAIKDRPDAQSDPALADSLEGVGSSLLAMHRPKDALAPLERALAIRKVQPVESEVAVGSLLLARALRGAGREPGRAHVLASSALAGFLKLGLTEEAERARRFLAAES